MYKSTQESKLENNEKRIRLYYIDTLRSVLMILGLFYHTALIYSINSQWVVHSTNTSIIATFLAKFLHSFRMETFFFISGFLFTHYANKYNFIQIIKKRAARIFVPALSTYISINTIQYYIYCLYSNKQFEIIYFFSKGFLYHNHLWFLENLLIYTLISSLFYKYIYLITKYFLRFNNFIKLILFPFAFIFILSTNKIGIPIYETYFNSIDLYSIIYYFQYYLLGTLCSIDNGSMIYISENIPIICIFLVFLFQTILYIINYFNFDNNKILNLLSIYIKSLNIICSISIQTYLSKKFFNKENLIIKLISNSSYTLYLFHHCFVIFFGFLFMKTTLPPILLLVLIPSLVFSICTSMHFLIISKYKVTSFLYNGIA